MSSFSWRLYRALNIFRRHAITRHPVYRREQRRIPVWRHSFGSWLNRGAGCLLMLACGAYFAVASPGSGFANLFAPLCCVGPLALVMLFMPLWTIPLSLALSPVIIRERTRGTWDLLRLTLLDLDTLLMAKTRSALQAIRPLLRYFMVGVIVVGLMVGFAFAVQIMAAGGLLDYYATSAASAHRPSGAVLLVLGIVLGAVGLVLYVADRVQQVLCMGIAALAAGSSAKRDGRGAVLYGIGAALVVWLVELALGAVILLIGATERELVTGGVVIIAVAGPLPGYMLMALTPWRMLIALIYTVGVRELALRRLWQWALDAAQRE